MPPCLFSQRRQDDTLIHRPPVSFTLFDECSSNIIRFHSNLSSAATIRIGAYFKPFAVEFQPFIDDIATREKAVWRCAEMATMGGIKGNSPRDLHETCV